MEILISIILEVSYICKIKGKFQCFLKEKQKACRLALALCVEDLGSRYTIHFEDLSGISANAPGFQKKPGAFLDCEKGKALC